MDPYSKPLVTNALSSDRLPLPRQMPRPVQAIGTRLPKSRLLSSAWNKRLLTLYSRETHREYMDQPQGDDENLKDECIVDQSKLHALFGELFWSLTSGSSDTLRVTATELCDVYLIFWIYLLLTYF